MAPFVRASRVVSRYGDSPCRTTSLTARSPPRGAGRSFCQSRSFCQICGPKGRPPSFGRAGLLACQAERSSAAHLQHPSGSFEVCSLRAAGTGARPVLLSYRNFGPTRAASIPRVSPAPVRPHRLMQYSIPRGGACAFPESRWIPRDARDRTGARHRECSRCHPGRAAAHRRVAPPAAYGRPGNTIRENRRQETSCPR